MQKYYEQHGVCFDWNVLTEMFTITEKSTRVRKSQIFDQPQPK